MNTASNLWSSLTQYWQHSRRQQQTQIHFDAEKCAGVWQCYEVCPMGCWVPDHTRQVVVFRDAERCIACGACVLQCPEDAIELR